MTPKEYGTFLRENSAFTVLIDNSSCRPVAEARVSDAGLMGRCVQVCSRDASLLRFLSVWLPLHFVSSMP